MIPTETAAVQCAPLSSMRTVTGTAAVSQSLPAPWLPTVFLIPGERRSDQSKYQRLIFSP